jgi:hypothetical protein
MAPARVEPPGARTTKERFMATQESSVFRPESAEDDTHPHACTDGLVFLTYTVFDEEVGDEVERIEAIPCRRCASERFAIAGEE